MNLNFETSIVGHTCRNSKKYHDKIAIKQEPQEPQEPQQPDEETPSNPKKKEKKDKKKDKKDKWWIKRWVHTLWGKACFPKMSFNTDLWPDNMWMILPFLLLNGPPTSKCEHVSTSLSPAFTVLFKRYWAHTVFVTRWNKRILRFVSAICGNCNWWNQRDQKAFLFGQCETTDENDGVLWNPFNFFILETSRPFGIPNWRFNFDSFIDRPFPSHIVFGFIPPKPGARAGHFVKGQSAAIGHGAVTSKTTTVSAVISDNQTIQNKFGHLMYIHVFHRCFWLQKEDRNSRVHNVYNCITPSFMSQPHHDGETPEDELYDLLTCHRDDPRYLLIGNFRCFFSFRVSRYLCAINGWWIDLIYI